MRRIKPRRKEHKDNKKRGKGGEERFKRRKTKKRKMNGWRITAIAASTAGVLFVLMVAFLASFLLLPFLPLPLCFGTPSITHPSAPTSFSTDTTPSPPPGNPAKSQDFTHCYLNAPQLRHMSMLSAHSSGNGGCEWGGHGGEGKIIDQLYNATVPIIPIPTPKKKTKRKNCRETGRTSIPHTNNIIIRFTIICPHSLTYSRRIYTGTICPLPIQLSFSCISSPTLHRCSKHQEEVRERKALLRRNDIITWKQKWRKQGATANNEHNNI